MSDLEQVAGVVARAMTDPAFRSELLASPAATLRSAGIDLPDGATVQVAENNASTAHLVVPAGLAAEERQQLVSLANGAGRTLTVLEATASNLWLVLPSSASAAQSVTLGELAESITESFTNLTKFITAASYLAGLAFSIGAIMKFKQHKDNPTQIPIGTPIALVFIAAALLFLPTILNAVGYKMFGDSGSPST